MANKALLKTVLSILLVSFSASAFSFNIYRVGDVVQGREYNDTLKRWFDRNFSIWVGVDEENNEYIFFKGETGLSDATVRVKNDQAIKNKLNRVVSKTIEWSGVAKANQADTTQGLGCLGDDQYDLCEKNSSAYDKNQISFTFFAANNGKQTDLIIGLVDRNNQFYEASIYISGDQIAKLKGAIDGIEQAFAKARETANNSELFK